MGRAVDGLLLGEAEALGLVGVDRAGVLDAGPDRDTGTEIGPAGDAVALGDGAVGRPDDGLVPPPGSGAPPGDPVIESDAAPVTVTASASSTGARVLVVASTTPTTTATVAPAAPTGTSHRGPGSIRWPLDRGRRARGSRVCC